MTDRGNEQHLALLLQSFNRNMYLSYLQKVGRIIEICGDSRYAGISIIRTPDIVGSLAFRLSFDYPVYIMLSHPICRFRSHRNYPIRERLFIANLGLVPVFFSSMNVMTVMKLWSDRAESFFNPANTPLSDTDTTCWEIPQSSKPMDYSSMNFILQNQSEPEEADPKIASIYEKYFRLGYWSFPKRGFTPSTHFLHGRTRISSQVKIAKSLYIIREIGRTQNFQMEGKTIEAVSVLLGGLAEDRGEYFFTQFPAFIDMEIAKQMEGKTDLSSSFVNGIVAEITSAGGSRVSMMTIVAEYGQSYFDILSSLIGIIADKKYSSNDSIATICTVDELREDVFNLYLDIYRKLRVPRTLSELISNSFDIALGAMLPVLVVDNGEVMMIHPLVWGFLKKWNLVVEDEMKQRDILLHLVKVMQHPETDGFSKLFLHDDAEFFGKLGLNKFNFVRAALRLAKDIRICKIMRRTLEI